MTFDEVCVYYGGAAAAAEALGIRRQTVYAWRYRGGIPLRTQYQIQVVSGGVLVANENAPDGGLSGEGVEESSGGIGVDSSETQYSDEN